MASQTLRRVWSTHYRATLRLWNNDLVHRRGLSATLHSRTAFVTSHFPAICGTG